MVFGELGRTDVGRGGPAKIEDVKVLLVERNMMLGFRWWSVL